jgi:hypothetical protein
MVISILSFGKAVIDHRASVTAVKGRVILIGVEDIHLMP